MDEAEYAFAQLKTPQAAAKLTSRSYGLYSESEVWAFTLRKLKTLACRGCNDLVTVSEMASVNKSARTVKTPNRQSLSSSL